MDTLARLRGLVVSCQPVPGGALDDTGAVVAMARAAVAGGAAGVRIEGVERVRAVRAAVAVPVIGLVKRDLAGSPVRITPFAVDAAALAAAGADIVAVDATDRARPEPVPALIAAARAGGALAMADCATEADARAALAAGAAVIGSTMSGYTEATATGAAGPDLALVRALARLGGFVMAEGRYDTPALCAAAVEAGADAVTVGTALTRLEVMTGRFAAAIAAARQGPSGFAVDLGGTKTAAARIEGGRIAARVQVATQAAAGLDSQLDTIAGLLADLGFVPGAPLGVAVSGRVDATGAWSAVNARTLPGIAGAPLGAALRARFGEGARPCNDALAAAVGEARFGAGRGSEAFGYLTVSTGVGGGFVLGGRPLTSPDGLAGHAGFLSSRLASAPCGSGRTGTVESVASGTAIARAAAEAGHPGLDAAAVAACGEAWAAAILDRSAAAVAALCADLAALLGLDRIALGGGVGLAEGYRARVERCLAAEPPLFRPVLVAPALGADSALAGALAVAADGA